MKTQYKIFTLAILVVAVVAFLLGRATITTKETIKYVKGKTIHDSVEVPVPEHTSIPKNPKLPMKHDTVKIKGDSIPYKVIEVVDTAKLIAEYISKRDYNVPIFNSKENGKLDVSLSVQYNKLQNFDYTYTPIQKETTKVKEKIITPFILTEYNSFKYFGVGGGVYYHNLGFEGKYITNFKDKGFSVGVNYKL